MAIKQKIKEALIDLGVYLSNGDNPIKPSKTGTLSEKPEGILIKLIEETETFFKEEGRARFGLGSVTKPKTPIQNFIENKVTNGLGYEKRTNQDNSEEALQSHLRDMDGKIGKHWFILEKPTFEDQVMIYMRELAYGGKK
ncbi:MAG: hypothetical protein KKF52_03105 [Nanoarchaeota archaeon]|nr:hypothetical protein [Nanoarchaeota archaeon]MBU4352038.1 hypothetical protein [Nanoarchaeota archaeon]